MTQDQSSSFNPSDSARLEDMLTTLGTHGFAFESGDDMRKFLGAAGLADWDRFAESWNRLGLDRYMADGGRYRKRRYATYALAAGRVERKRHQPHYQSRDYNLLNGGIERWFGPIEDSIAFHPAMLAILKVAHLVALRMTPASTQPDTWHAEVHQFRIEAQVGRNSYPTPEGLHRDGVDWVFVLMVKRENVASGVTTIHDEQRQEIGSFTLESPLDTALVDDHRVYHGVTALEPLEPSRPAHRDVLVVTLRHA